MDEFVYTSIGRYFHTLQNFGYLSYKNVKSLLVLIFFYNMIYHDYRGLIRKKDYGIIERALNCLYGTTCLIPYPDYLKMGKLKLGEMTEMAQRIKNIEEEPVLKLIHDISTVDNPENNSDVEVVLSEE